LRRVLVVIDADPRHSDRAVEGLRMSVGLTLSENSVRLLARGEGRRLLKPEREAFPDCLLARDYLRALEGQGAEVIAGVNILLEAREADVVIRWRE
jgi:hypothetical protein